MTLQLERAEDSLRERLQSEEDGWAAQVEAVNRRIAKIGAQTELTSDDEFTFGRLKDEADYLEERRKIAQALRVKHDLGSPADQSKDRNILNESVMNFLMVGPQAVENTDLIDLSGDLVFEFDESDITAAFNRPDVMNTPVVRPSDGWYSSAMARVLRRLNSFGGASRVCDRIITPDGNDIKMPTMDSTLVGDGFAEDANAAVASTPTTFVNLVSKRNGYRSKKFVYARSADRDARFNMERVLADTLANQIGRAFAQDLIKGDITGTDVIGFASPAGVKRTATTTGTADNGTSRRFGGNSLEQLEVRLRTLMELVPSAYIMGEGGEDGFSPLQPNVAFVMNYRTWGAIEAITSTSQNSFVSEGRTPLTNAVVRTLKSVPVVFDDTMDAPTGANDVFAANSNILMYGNFRYMLIRRIGRVRLHIDPFGVAGDNNQISLLMFAEGDNRPQGGIDTSDSNRTEAIGLLQAFSA